MTEQVLSVRELEVRYGSTTVFSGLGLEIGAGEAVAVMGPSGSGKSSLLACVTGMLVPSAGQVKWADGSSRGCPAASVRLSVVRHWVWCSRGLTCCPSSAWRRTWR